MANSARYDKNEHLLASLKRLVSDEAIEHTKKQGRLFLDSSLRVDHGAKKSDEAVSPKPLVLSNKLEAKVAQLEEIIARSNDQWEPDGSYQDEYSGLSTNALKWDQVADAASDGFAEDAQLQVAEVENLATSQYNDTPEEAHQTVGVIDVDQSQLREMVVQIVRDELRGELGDKVTANLRKMIRREILRVLDEQDGPTDHIA